MYKLLFSIAILLINGDDPCLNSNPLRFDKYINSPLPSIEINLSKGVKYLSSEILLYSSFLIFLTSFKLCKYLTGFNPHKGSQVIVLNIIKSGYSIPYLYSIDNLLKFLLLLYILGIFTIVILVLSLQYKNNPSNSNFNSLIPEFLVHDPIFLDTLLSVFFLSYLSV